MQDWQQRVVDEKKELDIKASNLRIFIVTDFFSKLPADEQLRMRQQSSLMKAYSDILGERIANFKE